MKVQNADIVIIGGGAAGLMAAAGAGITSPDKKIVVLKRCHVLQERS
jgi:succinate dehydrogenase/fumarate reductase flavoprotein subunit